MIVLAACGGGSSQPSNQTIRGSGNEFVFQAPYSWHVRRRDSQVQAVPKPVSPELVSVSVFPLLHPYKPSPRRPGSSMRTLVSSRPASAAP